MIGDHVLITMTLNERKVKPTTSYKQNWRNYSKDKLMTELQKIVFSNTITDVQSFWNSMELKLVELADLVAPMEEFIDNKTTESDTQSPIIKRKINLRKRLLQRLRLNPTNELRQQVKNLTKEIKVHYIEEKRKKVRRGIVPGNSKSLWRAVDHAKDMNSNELPSVLVKGDDVVKSEDLAEMFAEMFKQKF